MYTSELQKTLAGRWHIPCARDGLWLCLSDTPTVGQQLGTEDTADFNGSSDLITSGKNDNSCNSPSSYRRERTGGEEGGDRVNSRDSSSKAAYPLGLDLAVDTFHSSYSNPQGHLKLNTSFDEASVSIITDAIDKDWSTPRKTETILSISASAVRDLEELRVDSKSKIQRVEKKKNPNQETHLNSSYYDENGS